jgi:iron complex outermembrane receptor protein
MWGTVGLVVVILSIAAPPAGASDGGDRPVDGVVLDRSGVPVEGVRVTVGGEVVAVTGPDGEFNLTLAPGGQDLVVSHPAFQTRRLPLPKARDLRGLRIELSPVLSASESITVTAVRASDQVPVTKRNLDRKEIAEISFGQDVPQLLQSTPSVTWYSDSGIGSNYSYLGLRGIQQTRISMTLDGAPLNDPAESAVYFNNFHDVASAVDSIQVQRGVGISSVGASAYGGSINFASAEFTQTPQGEARITCGSYDTASASVGFQSGIVHDHFAVSGRVSYSTSDGYRDSSGSEHVTFFLDAGWRGDRSTLKLVSFSGDERSQLAYLAVDSQILDRDPRFNPLGADDRDHFGQDFAQLQYTRELGSRTALTASLYYNGADGWFRLWDDSMAEARLLRFGIDQSYVGSMVSLTTATDRFAGNFGVHYTDFAGDHTLHDGDELLYSNTGYKRIASSFVRAEYWFGPWLLFGDLQLRWAEFSYQGDVDLGSVDWTFLDPKVGARRVLTPRLSLYASFGQAQREPTRLDLLLGEDNASIPHDLQAVRPEQVVDLEAGVNLNTRWLALQANLYWMEFDDEIALSGELSEIGLPLRRNVDESYRRGLELDLRWIVAPNWTLTTSAALSRNRILEWTQYYDVYDVAGEWIASEAIAHHDVTPLLTPEVILNQGVEWRWGSWEAAAMGRFISVSHLDNTGSDDFLTPSYVNLDMRASLTLDRWRAAGRPKITLFVNNVLDDERQYPSGYSYQYLTRDPSGDQFLDGTKYYYPLAARNFVVAMDFRF